MSQHVLQIDRPEPGGGASTSERAGIYHVTSGNLGTRPHSAGLARGRSWPDGRYHLYLGLPQGRYR